MKDDHSCFLWLITQMHPEWVLVFDADGEVTFDADGWNEN